MEGLLAGVIREVDEGGHYPLHTVTPPVKSPSESHIYTQGYAMSTKIVFVDGAVNAGKSTVMKMIPKVIPKDVVFASVEEPIIRDVSGQVAEDIGYNEMFNFIVARKRALIRHFSRELASENNGVIFVERSFIGDFDVRLCDKTYPRSCLSLMEEVKDTCRPCEMYSIVLIGSWGSDSQESQREEQARVLSDLSLNNNMFKDTLHIVRHTDKKDWHEDYMRSLFRFMSNCVLQ